MSKKKTAKRSGHSSNVKSSGLINSGKHSLLFEFTNGIKVDQALFEFEIRTQRAWVNALAKAKLLSQQEAKKIQEVFDEALQEHLNDSFVWRVEDEDVHMHLERYITDRLGDLGKRIHFGRSRNDLIATTLRLAVTEYSFLIASLLEKLVRTVFERADKDLDIILPGQTHLQSAQPVRLSHIYCGHGYSLYKDLERLRGVAERTQMSMPLGAAAMAGSPLNLDYAEMAEELGFLLPCVNAYEAVGDRDFILDALSVFAQIAVHLSRFCEDVIYWSSSSVGNVLQLSKNWSTGSSIMPNKRNPDVCELVRAKMAKVIGLQQSGFVLMKGLPTSYNSDLHELKSVFFDAFDLLFQSVEILIPFVKELEVNAVQAERILNQGHILATEIADFLVEKGVPFREAYLQVAQAVERANQLGKQVHELELSEFLKILMPTSSKVLPAKISPAKISNEELKNFLENLNFENAVERRSHSGGTAYDVVSETIQTMLGALGE